MELRGRRIIKVSQEQVWQALNNPQILKESIAGCEDFVKTTENNYSVRVIVSVGPIKAKFQGRLLLDNLNPPNSYSLVFEGQGGMAGYAKGNAEVSLTPSEEGTVLTYLATTQVGGKLAQVGSRLIESAARKVSDDFFSVFEEKLIGAETPTLIGAEAPTSGGRSHQPNFSPPIRWLVYGTGLITSIAVLYWWLAH